MLSSSRLSGADGFIFGNVLGDDVVLPRVTDIRKVIEATKKQAKVVIVASNDWILPSNPVFCEVARQVKMTCGEFTVEFMRNTSNLSDEEFTEAMTSSKPASSLRLHQQYDLTTVSGPNPVIVALKAQITTLEANAEANAETIAQLEETIETLKADHIIALTAKDVEIEDPRKSTWKLGISSSVLRSRLSARSNR